MQSVADIAEVAIDVSLGVAIPGHEAAKFASKQDSLHALMVEWERSEESVPYLLRAKFFSSAVLGENGDSVSAGRPQSFEAVIKQVFDDIAYTAIQARSLWSSTASSSEETSVRSIPMRVSSHRNWSPRMSRRR